MNKRYWIVLVSLIALWTELVILHSHRLGSAVAETTTVTPPPVEVKATVSPQTTDLSFDFTKSGGQIDKQDSEAEFQLTFGSHLSFATPLLLVATWSQGKIDNYPGPAMDMITYVGGTATKALGTYPPVIDTVNRTITWTIDAFPTKTTDKTVTFRLQTNSLYTGSSAVHINVNASLTANRIALPPITVGTDYHYQAAPASTPTITPTPTPEMTPAISIDTITASFSAITVRTESDTTITLSYGKNARSLSTNVTSSIGKTHHFLLSELSPETRYFFRAVAVNLTGDQIQSDIYSFTTATVSVPPAFKEQTLIITSYEQILMDPVIATVRNNNRDAPVIIVPKNHEFAFRFSLGNQEKITRVQVLIRKKPEAETATHANVLGLTTAETYDVNTGETDLVEIDQGTFVGRLRSPQVTGIYEAVTRISDSNGNIVERLMSNIHVSEDLIVSEDGTNQPIEAAQIYLSYLNTKTGTYLPLPPQIFAIKNPLYSDRSGHIRVLLPQGRYKATVTSIGFERKEAVFTLGTSIKDGYPVIVLRREPFNILTRITYYLSILNDFFRSALADIRDISDSSRFFELNAVAATGFLVFLTFLSFATRIHIPLRSLTGYFIHKVRISAIQKTERLTIQGKIYDSQSGEPVTMANVYLISREKNTTVSHAHTDRQGSFFFIKLPAVTYDLHIIKRGYSPILLHDSDIAHAGSGSRMINITRHDKPPTVWEDLRILFEKLFSLLFELLLVLSALFELTLGSVLGWIPVLPFLLFSTVNLFLWLLHESSFRSQKGVL